MNEILRNFIRERYNKSKLIISWSLDVKNKF